MATVRHSDMGKRVLIASVLLLASALLFALGRGSAESCDAPTPSRLLGHWEHPNEAWVTVKPRRMTYGFRDVTHPWEESIGLCYLGTTERSRTGTRSDELLYEDVFGAFGGEGAHYFPRLVVVSSIPREAATSKPAIRVQWCATAAELRYGLCHEDTFECLHGECLTSRSTRSRAETRAPG